MMIRVEEVSKAFTIRHNRSYFLKEKFIALFSDKLKERKETFWALRGVNLELKRGESLGLIGPNGSGKSTLLKLVAKILIPTKGSVVTKGRVAPMIELGVGFHPDLSGRENIYLNASLYGLSKVDVDKIYDKIIDFSGLSGFIDTPIRNYSSGMQMRLAFSISVHIEPDIFLIDEILAVGDERFQKKCLHKMEGFRNLKTIVFVSHDLSAVEAMCDKVCLLNDGKVVSVGSPKSTISEYRKLLEKEVILSDVSK